MISMIESEELKRMIGRMLLDPENECTEFKEAKNDFRFEDLGRYFSAISNEANIRMMQYGWILFGVDDKRNAVGTNYRNSRKSLDELKISIREHTTDSLTFIEIYETEYDGKRIVAFQIPAAGRVPVGWRGTAYGREGESLVNLTDSKADRIRENGSRDWSERICVSASFDDLDKKAVKELRRMFEANNKNKSSLADMTALTDESFLRKLRLMNGASVTNAAMVLLSSERSAYKTDPVPEIVWIIRNSKGDTLGGETFTGSLILGIDSVLSKIRNLDYRFIKERGTVNTVETKMYDVSVLRELLHNSVAHQDYGMKGRISVIENERFLDIHNLGSFIPVSVERVMDIEFVPPYYRNRLLATVMRDVGMIERYGSGIRRTMAIQASRCFPLPDFKTESAYVDVKVYGSVINDAYTWMLNDRSDLDLKDVYLLDRVQKGKELTDIQISILKEKRLITIKRSGISVAGADRTNQGKNGDGGLCRKYLEEYLEEHPESDRREIDGRLWNMLPDGLSDESKKNRIHSMLQSMAKEGIIENIGTRRHPRWRLRL